MNLDEEGYLVRCDWCGDERNYLCKSGDGYRVWHCNCQACDLARSDLEPLEVWMELMRQPDGKRFHYSRALPPEFPRDLCRDCAIKLTPWVQRFVDIYEVHLSNSRLERAINGKRKENRRTADHGATSDHACQCG